MCTYLCLLLTKYKRWPMHSWFSWLERMDLKLLGLVVVALVALASATPDACHSKAPKCHQGHQGHQGHNGHNGHNGHSGHKGNGGHHGHKGHCGHSYKTRAKYYLTPRQGKGKCLGAFGFLAQGLKGIPSLKTAKTILTDISNKHIAKDISEALNGFLSVAKSIGIILNQLFDTLGTIVSNTVIVIIRIVTCVLGSPFSKGNYFNRHGQRCSTPIACTKDFGVSQGWKPFNGGCNDDAKKIMKFYEVVNIKVTLQGILDKFCGGDVNKLTGTRKMIMLHVIDLVAIFDKDPSEWNSDIMYLCFKHVSAMSAAVGQACFKGSGADILEGLIIYMNIAFRNHGYKDIRPCGKEIKKQLGDCNPDDLNGAIEPFTDSSDTNDNGNNPGDTGNGNNAGDANSNDTNDTNQNNNNQNDNSNNNQNDNANNNQNDNANSNQNGNSNNNQNDNSNSNQNDNSNNNQIDNANNDNQNSNNGDSTSYNKNEQDDVDFESSSEETYTKTTTTTITYDYIEYDSYCENTTTTTTNYNN